MSSIVPLKGFGSGGVALNFKVVDGTAQPANPKENTIWVITSEKMTGWVFSATEPEAPAEGMVWIATGVASPVAFNALKRQGMMIYPLLAKQYFGGIWEPITAQSFQNGVWRDWLVYAFFEGDLCEDITGGWIPVQRSVEINPVLPTMTIKDGKMTVSAYKASAANYFGGTVQTNNKIDMTPYSAVVFHVTDFACDAGSGTPHFVIGVTGDAEKAKYTMDAYAEITSNGYVTVDVSGLDISCVIAINPRSPGLAGSTAYITVDQIHFVW